jgi:hypothetical protein
LSPGQVISSAKPGEKIAKAIDEIQSVISAMQGADKDDKADKVETKVATLSESTAKLAEKVADNTTTFPPTTAILWQVLTWNGSGWVADWVRATA